MERLKDTLDIRENAGSTSSIYAEYLARVKEKLAEDSIQENKIATALMHGIRTDTDNYVNAYVLIIGRSQFLSPLGLIVIF